MVINAYASGAGTIAEVAEQFRVGTAFVKKILRLPRAGESLVPKHGGGAPAKLKADAREKLRGAVARRPEATLGELPAVLSSRCKVEVSEPTVCRELQRLELPRKKRASSPANAMSSSGAPVGRKSWS